MATGRLPPPREVQLVLDPEFVAELPGGSVALPGRHLVLDPEYLTERRGGTTQQGVRYD